MIITKIRLEEEHPSGGWTNNLLWPLPSCDFLLNADAGENGYILKDSSGLAPPKINPIVVGFDPTGVPIVDGFTDKRELVFRVGLSPGLGQTYSSLRDDLYMFINRTVCVDLMDESEIIAEITGYIERIDATIFSPQPELQITIICDDGVFTAPAAVNIPSAELNTLTPLINYEKGTAPTGLDLQFRVTAPTGSFSITGHSRMSYLGSVQPTNTFTVTYAMLANDVVTISTTAQQKKITLLRGATTYDITGYLNAGAVWPQLYRGVNSFSWTFASSWMTWLSATYLPKYWGV